MNFLPFEQYLAGISGMHAGNHFNQGRFAGPVFAQKGVNFAAFKVEINILQRLDAGKELPAPRTESTVFDISCPSPSHSF